MDIFDLPKREQELARLEAAVTQPDLWDDTEKAQKTMQALARARESVIPYKEMTARYEDARTLLEMAEAEQDGENYEEEIRAEITAMKTAAGAMEIQTLLSGPHDASNAILELKPGAGGTEACDWAAMLLRMYLRWAERNGFKADIVDELPGDVAGVSSATVFITGANAYGMLRSEHGVHRLVRISPFNANGKRQTSFAAVEVSPQIEDAGEVEINPDDLDWDYFRASGAGGQHVNKTSSAVRLKHRPTGLIVECQNERSQHQNKEVALKILRGRLAERADREAEAKMVALRGEQRAIEWGSQIRSYVFQPYTLVKDHRNGVETGDVQKVMDGGVEPFQTGYLRWRTGNGSGSSEDTNGSADLP